MATCKRMKLVHSLTPYIKVHSRCIKDLNVRPDTIKLLQENIDRLFFEVNNSSIFLNLSPKVMETKAQINKWDIIKFKSFYTANKTVNKINILHSFN